MKKKGKGLSFDQKRDKMLKIFHDTKSVFNYEEIEKLSIKAGIPFPSVKEILNSLKADSLIECQKIGAGVFYWSFPSKTVQIFENKIKYSGSQIDFYKTQLEKLEEQLSSCQIGRQETPERSQQQERFKNLCQEEADLKKQINKYIRFDPQRYQLIGNDVSMQVKENKEVKEAINNQTDNLEQIKKFIKKQQPGTKDTEIEEAYGIPADLDYIE